MPIANYAHMSVWNLNKSITRSLLCVCSYLNYIHIRKPWKYDWFEECSLFSRHWILQSCQWVGGLVRIDQVQNSHCTMFTCRNNDRLVMTCHCYYYIIILISLFSLWLRSLMITVSWMFEITRKHAGTCKGWGWYHAGLYLNIYLHQQ